MRVNEYNSLEEFYNEYAYGSEFSWENEEGIRRFIGIEFMYHGKQYRMCNEPLRKDELPILSNGKIGHYDVMEMVEIIKEDREDDDWNYYDFKLIGWYENLDDVFENCYIEGRKFKDVIMDDETVIIGKD